MLGHRRLLPVMIISLLVCMALFGALQPSLAFRTLTGGDLFLANRLLGSMPFRRAAVDGMPAIEVVPGGHSIGVLLEDDGITVVGHAPVSDGAGHTWYPARDAGLRVDDMIMSINGKPVTAVHEVAALVELAGEADASLLLVIRRSGQLHRVQLSPVYNPDQRRWLMGVWIRDSVAGVGTLTFYHPASGLYGALGHLITGPDNRRAVDVGNGQIVEAAVLGIEKGQQGRPGEKLGQFSSRTLGNVQRNTVYGIFGRLAASPPSTAGASPVRVASASQVQTGAAEIITVIEGEEAQYFTVEIERIINRQPGGKNLIVRIVDPRLLAATGGIVQGMSGSPILQNGRLVGAVTHVFINDPTRGYGVLAHWMIVNSGLLEQMTAIKPQAA